MACRRSCSWIALLSDARVDHELGAAARLIERVCHLVPHRLRGRAASGCRRVRLWPDLRLRAELLDLNHDAFAVHLCRVDGHVDGDADADVVDVEHLRLVQQCRQAVGEFDESTDDVRAVVVVVLLRGKAQHLCRHGRADGESSDLFLQASNAFFSRADDLAHDDLVFVEDDARAQLGCRGRAVPFVVVGGLGATLAHFGRGHGSSLDERFQNGAGVGQEVVATLFFGGWVLAGQETIGDEAVGVAFDRDDQTRLGLIGDLGDSAVDDAAGDDGDCERASGCLGGELLACVAGRTRRAGGIGGRVQDRSFQIRGVCSSSRRDGGGVVYICCLNGVEKRF